jgi:hypothetical protein
MAIQNFFSNIIPPNEGTDNVSYNMGFRFTLTALCKIVGVRFYKPSLEPNIDHLGTLWDADTSTLIDSIIFADTSSSAGWKEVYFLQPIDAVVGKRYIVAVNCGNGSNAGYYPYQSAYHSSEIQQGLITATVSAGLFNGSHTGIPNAAFNNATYFRDVIISTGEDIRLQSSSLILLSTINRLRLDARLINTSLIQSTQSLVLRTDKKLKGNLPTNLTNLLNVKTDKRLILNAPLNSSLGLALRTDKKLKGNLPTNLTNILNLRIDKRLILAAPVISSLGFKLKTDLKLKLSSTFSSTLNLKLKSDLRLKFPFTSVSILDLKLKSDIKIKSISLFSSSSFVVLRQAASLKNQSSFLINDSLKVKTEKKISTSLVFPSQINLNIKTNSGSLRSNSVLSSSFNLRLQVTPSLVVPKKGNLQISIQRKYNLIVTIEK